MSGEAFRIKDGDSDLSVNWVEFFGEPDLNVAIELVQHDLEGALSLSKNGLFALLNVAEAKTIIQTLIKREPGIVHDPTEFVESHTRMCGFAPEEFLVSTALASAVVCTFPVK